MLYSVLSPSTLQNDGNLLPEYTAKARHIDSVLRSVDVGNHGVLEGLPAGVRVENAAQHTRRPAYIAVPQARGIKQNGRTAVISGAYRVYHGMKKGYACVVSWEFLLKGKHGAKNNQREERTGCCFYMLLEVAKSFRHGVCKRL